MSVTLSPSENRTYGVTLVCRAWEIGRSTYYDWRDRRSSDAEPRRRGPRPAISDAELAEAIGDLHARLEADYGIRGEGYRKSHARLRPMGIHVGRDRVLRVMREHGLLSPTRVGRARGPQVHDGRITTDRPDEMWGTDATRTLTLEEGQAWIFAAIDHCNGEIVGIHAASRGNRYEALEPINQAVRARFGEVEQGLAAGLALRHDHGTQYMSRAFQAELAFLGIESNPSFVRQPERNGTPNASCGPSRSSCSGSVTSGPSRTCASRCSTFSAPTTVKGHHPSRT